MTELKLIAFDLDGTVLMNDHIHPAPGILSALDLAHREGIYTVPVTGRPWGLLPPFFQEKRSWFSLGIFCNGGELRNLKTGETLFSLHLPKEALNMMISQSEAYGIPAEFCTDEEIYLTGKSWEQQKCNPELSFHCNTILRNHGVLMENLRDLPEEKIQKGHLNGVSRDLQPVFGKEYESLGLGCAWSEEGFGEITPSEASKGQALRKLCGMLGISIENVLSLGDSDNDLSMLQAAGLGIAMGNAPKWIKRAADEVTDPNEQDGAAKAIIKYIKKK